MKLLYSEHPSISTSLICDLRRAFRHYRILVTDHLGRTSPLVRADMGRIVTQDFTILNRNYRVIEVVMPREFVMRADEYPGLTVEEYTEQVTFWTKEWGCYLRATIAGDWGNVKAIGEQFQVNNGQILLMAGNVSVTVPLKGFWWIKLVPYVDIEGR